MTKQNQKHILRFSRLNRILHVVMIISFITLAITGMILKFSYTPWSFFLAHFFGGFESAGLAHRFAAILMTAVFFTHLIDLYLRKKNEFGSWKKMLSGSHTMVFTKKDWHDLRDSIKWFLGKAPRPQYGRWTYWEKFDYFAVFWGMIVIGSTGMTLWFPEFLLFFPRMDYKCCNNYP